MLARQATYVCESAIFIRQFHIFRQWPWMAAVVGDKRRPAEDCEEAAKKVTTVSRK